MVIFKNIITIEKGKKSGKPCIRGMRISVDDIINMLASDMSFDEIIKDFPELTKYDIKVALEFTSFRQNRIMATS